MKKILALLVVLFSIFTISSTAFAESASIPVPLSFGKLSPCSITVQNTLGAGFEAAGFSVSASSASTTTYRKVASIDVTWKVGDPLL